MIPLVQTAVSRFIVSTVYSSDAGWETAIIGREGLPIPVARYRNLEEAKAGHKDWVDKLTEQGPTALPVVKLGWGPFVGEQMCVVDPMTLEDYKKAVKSILPDMGGGS